MIDANTDHILKISFRESKGLKSNLTDTEHLLLAIMKNKKNNAYMAITEQNISYNNLKDLLKEDIQFDPSKDFPIMGASFTDDDDDDEEEQKYYIDQSKNTASK